MPIGVNIAKRTLAATAKPTIEISEENGVYTLKTSSIFKNTSISFKLGEEFDEETADGRKCKVNTNCLGRNFGLVLKQRHVN